METYLLGARWVGHACVHVCVCVCFGGIWSTQVGEQWHARCLKRNGWLSIGGGGRDGRKKKKEKKGVVKMIGAEVGGGDMVVMGEQPAGWGRQGGNWTALFMLGLFQPTLRTLRSSSANCFSLIFEKVLNGQINQMTLVFLKSTVTPNLQPVFSQIQLLDPHNQSTQHSCRKCLNYFSLGLN